MSEIIPCGTPLKANYPERPECEHGPMHSRGSKWCCRALNRAALYRWRAAHPVQTRSMYRTSNFNQRARKKESTYREMTK